MRCQNIILTIPDNIVNGHDVCEHCFIKPTRLYSNEEVDEIIKNKGINFKRIGNYTGNKNKIEWECLNDGNIVLSTPFNIFSGSNPCQICSPNRKWTNDLVDEELIKTNRTIERIGEVVNSSDKLEWKCLECNKTWFSSITGIIIVEHGCPNCRNQINWSCEVIRKLLDENNKNHIEIIDCPDNVTCHSKIKVRCQKDGHEWEPVAREVCLSSGCPKCSGLLKLTNSDIDFRLEQRESPTIRIGNVDGVNNPIEWQCKQCNNIWEAPPIQIIHQEQDCPKCFRHDVYKSEKMVKSILKLFQITEIYPHHFIKNIKIFDENGIIIRKKVEIDFMILLNNTIYFVEYQGLHHYKPIKYRGMTIEDAEEKYRKQVIRDSWVRDYCKQNNIVLIEIDCRKHKKKQQIIDFLKNQLNL